MSEHDSISPLVKSHKAWAVAIFLITQTAAIVSIWRGLESKQSALETSVALYHGEQLELKSKVEKLQEQSDAAKAAADKEMREALHALDKRLTVIEDRKQRR